MRGRDMLLGRGKGGQKQSKWAKAGAARFGQFFARRSQGSADHLAPDVSPGEPPSDEPRAHDDEDVPDVLPIELEPESAPET